MKSDFIFISALALGLLAVPPVPARSEPGAHTRGRYLMGTVCRISAEDGPGVDHAVAAAFDEIARVESLLSTWREGTALSRVNRAPLGTALPLGSELFGLLHQALDWERRTEGAFNPLLGPLVRAWDLRGRGRWPGEATLRDARRLSRARAVSLDPRALTVTRREEAGFEEGGFGKGYALDRAVAVLRAQGVPRAWLDFGGQVSLYGFPNGFEVAVAHPRERRRPALSLRVREGSLSTSAGSERTFRARGVDVTHLLDPRTGLALPPRGSVSVLDPSGFRADVLSTALYVMGPARAMAWADAHGVAAIALWPAGRSGRFRVARSAAARSLVDLEMLHPDLIGEDPPGKE